jgi:uncharacterized protein
MSTANVGKANLSYVCGVHPQFFSQQFRSASLRPMTQRAKPDLEVSEVVAMSSLRQLWNRLLSLEARPESVALGFSLGVFLGFTPLFGLKTLLALLLASLFRSSKLAAFLGVTVHDVLLPFIPVLLRAEYQLGYWCLSNPHHFAPKLHLGLVDLHAALSWSSIFTTTKPLLIGSVILGFPIAAVSYFAVRAILSRITRTRLALAPAGLQSRVVPARTAVSFRAW